jgi:hypothetical protein
MLLLRTRDQPDQYNDGPDQYKIESAVIEVFLLSIYRRGASGTDHKPSRHRAPRRKGEMTVARGMILTAKDYDRTPRWH